MIAAIDIALRASLVLIVALAATAALRRRSAALRHWILAAGIVGAAAVAPLGRTLPSWTVALLPAPPIGLGMAQPGPPPEPLSSDIAATVTARAVAERPVREVPIPLIVNSLWMAGFIVALSTMAVRLRRLARLKRLAAPVTERRWIDALERLCHLLGVERRVSILTCDRAGLVGTFGWQSPCVLLPPESWSWDDERVRVVLGHELAHIRRGDWIVQMSAELVRAVFWYNPLFWIAVARLRSESERACDDTVVNAGVPAPDYAAHLLAIARVSRHHFAEDTVVPMARHSTLERRITAMLNTTLVHQRPSRRAFATAFAAIALITVAAASFRASAQVEPRPLTGTVYDMTGAVLPQVALIFADASGERQIVTTDRNGRFDLGVVAPGRYRLSATLIGFAGVTHEIVLREAGNWDRAIIMHVGTLQETITARSPRPAGAPPRTTTESPIGGNIRTPMKTNDVRPVYPQALRDAGVEGVVPIGAFIGADGSVASVRVLSARAHPDLANAAVDAVRQWRFTPTLLNGEAIEIYMTVTVRFTMEN